MSVPEYKYLRISGTISAELSTSSNGSFSATNILLFGCTGSGKSNFIECIAQNPALKISGNSLESVTQKLTVYKLNNVKDGIIRTTLHLMDCPGTSDNNLSEMAIIKALQSWVSLNDSPQIILYFHRITDKRLPGSHRQSLKLIQELRGDSRHFRTWTGVVTTMWDTLLDHQVSDAEERLVQLRRDHLKDICSADAGVFQFFNTHDSALNIIDQALGLWRTTGRLNKLRNPPLAQYNNKALRQAPFAPTLHKLFESRILSLSQRIQAIKDDINMEDAQSSSELMQILTRDLEVAENLMEEMMQESAEYLMLPAPIAERPSIGHRITKYIRDKLL